MVWVLAGGKTAIVEGKRDVWGGEKGLGRVADYKSSSWVWFGVWFCGEVTSTTLEQIHEL